MVVNMTWTRDPVTAWMPGYRAWVKALHDMVRGVLEARMPEIDEWMKEHAVWVDRTGLARKSLHTELEEYLEGYVLSFSYSIVVPYAVYLEYDHQGRFAILQPAVDYWGPILLADLRERILA